MSRDFLLIIFKSRIYQKCYCNRKVSFIYVDDENFTPCGVYSHDHKYCFTCRNNMECVDSDDILLVKNFKRTLETPVVPENPKETPENNEYSWFQTLKKKHK